MDKSIYIFILYMFKYCSLWMWSTFSCATGISFAWTLADTLINWTFGTCVCGVGVFMWPASGCGGCGMCASVFFLLNLFHWDSKVRARKLHMRRSCPTCVCVRVRMFSRTNEFWSSAHVCGRLSININYTVIKVQKLTCVCRTSNAVIVCALTCRNHRAMGAGSAKNEQSFKEKIHLLY